MTRFLVKGLLRDRSRSLFPLLTVVAGVALTVVLYSWVRGTEADLVRASASFNTGHLRVTTRGDRAPAEQTANQLWLVDVGAFWQGREDPGAPTARGLAVAVLVYNTAVAVLAASGVGSHVSAVGIWPAIGLHAALAVWCAWSLRTGGLRRPSADG